MNNENLKNLKEYSKEDRQEIARLGGIKSGIAKREKKQMRFILNELLDKKITDIFEIKELKEANIHDFSYRTLICYSLIKKATKGDVEAYKQILKTLGEDTPQPSEAPLPILNIEVVDNTKLLEDIYNQ